MDNRTTWERIEDSKVINRDLILDEAISNMPLLCNSRSPWKFSVMAVDTKTCSEVTDSDPERILGRSFFWTTPKQIPTQKAANNSHGEIARRTTR
jgi:hypothetical protein